jgi:hypothetical protein
MPAGHQYFSPALFDEMSLHIHGNVTDAGTHTGYQQHKRQYGHRTSHREHCPAAQAD